MLKATAPILYRSKLYGVGDLLPSDNPAMVEAWIEARSAKWSDENEEAAAPKPKARMVTSQPGMPGLSSDGDPEALIGRVPKRAVRKKSK